jgi:hypothetical protein
MTKSEQNLSVIQNFILYITHDTTEKITFTTEQLYQLAIDYIEEDHVDGKENKENNVTLLNFIQL